MPLLLWFLFALLTGAAIGSFINVCVDRLTYEKSLLWPNSRCSACLRPVRWYDNLPILSYLILGGKCRSCHAPFGLRVLIVELITPLAFAFILYMEAVHNSLGLRLFQRVQPSPYSLVIPLHHAILFAFLFTASLCDLIEMEIPLTVTVPGTLMGLILSTLSPWPLPGMVPTVPPKGIPPWEPPAIGVHAWPVWYPLPDWLPAGSWQLGLLTGLAGAVTGMATLRVVAWLFKVGRGIDGLGVGDADLMMMVGAFLGWQPVVLAFFVAVGPAFIFALVQLATRGNQPLPFGPSLALGAMITALFWPSVGQSFALLFFDPVMLGLLAGAGTFVLLTTSFVLRLRGTSP